MASGLLSLKWNNHRSTFFHVLSSIRSKESYCDATLACDGRFYPVHKLVLSTCSEYFEQIFERTQCKHPVIVLKDIKYDDLEALMNYMYVGEVNVLQEKLAGLIKAAECLKIKGLAVPDEDPLNTGIKEKRNQIRVDAESPRAKRRRRDDSTSYDEREKHIASRNLRLSQRDHQQISQLENRNDLNQLEETSVLDSKLKSDNHTQNVESESEQADSEHQNRKQRSSSGPLSQRPSSQKPIPEVSIDETSVKAEPPDIQEEEVDSKETLHSNLGYDPAGGDADSGADPESVASGSNEAGFSDSNMMEPTPQSVEDVVAQAIPPSSSSFQGNSFSLWEGEGSLQNFPGEGFSGENSQGRPMFSACDRLKSLKRNCETRAEEMPPVEGSSNVESFAPDSAAMLAYPHPSSSFAFAVDPRLNYGLNIPQGREKTLPPSKKYTCNVCRIQCKSLIGLKVHKESHENLKRYNCTNCSYKSFRKQDLVYHFRTHTGEKPYTCPFCPHKSSVMSNMKTHIRRRHDQAT